MFRIGVLLVAATLVIAPGISVAQDKDQFRKQAKEYAAKLREFGEPLDRCFLGAALGSGAGVIRTNGTSLLKPGDKLLALNGVSTVGKTADDIITILRGVRPTEVLSVTVERDEHSIDLSVACSNSKQVMEPMLAAVDFIARGKFDDCVRTISQMPYIDTHLATLRAQCASFSRNLAQYNVSDLVSQAMEMAINDAFYAPSARANVAKQLHNVEGIITQGQGAARYQAMVEATKRWPGGETLYESSAPDWALFRRNSEAALRNRLIDPDSARIQWPHGFLFGTWKPFLSKAIEGYWTCGLINARNRMGGYTGTAAFVVVLDSTGFVKYSQVGEAKDYDMTEASCSKSVKLLPPPPVELTSVASESKSNEGGDSIADNLAKLADLRNAGALTEAEFQAAKAKLLGESTR